MACVRLSLAAAARQLVGCQHTLLRTRAASCMAAAATPLNPAWARAAFACPRAGGCRPHVAVRFSSGGGKKGGGGGGGGGRRSDTAGRGRRRRGGRRCGRSRGCHRGRSGWGCGGGQVRSRKAGVSRGVPSACGVDQAVFAAEVSAAEKIGDDKLVHVVERCALGAAHNDQAVLAHIRRMRRPPWRLKPGGRRVERSVKPRRAVEIVHKELVRVAHVRGAAKEWPLGKGHVQHVLKRVSAKHQHAPPVHHGRVAKPCVAQWVQQVGAGTGTVVRGAGGQVGCCLDRPRRCGQRKPPHDVGAVGPEVDVTVEAPKLHVAPASKKHKVSSAGVINGRVQVRAVWRQADRACRRKRVDAPPLQRVHAQHAERRQQVGTAGCQAAKDKHVTVHQRGRVPDDGLGLVRAGRLNLPPPQRAGEVKHP
eukprot:m.47389 g.47389  ORF g.47389 m.47389 type:complete len:421 (+) comp11916_c0_seq1:518-1780(+)